MSDKAKDKAKIKKLNAEIEKLEYKEKLAHKAHDKAIKATDAANDKLYDLEN